MGSAIALVVSYVLLEALWFSFTLSRIYTPLFADVQNDDVVYRPVYALPAYAILTYALWLLVVSRASSRLGAARDASAFALAVGGVYNLTNLCTLKRYPLWVALVDMAWGLLSINAATQLALSF
jgi:uncharacterized membrane protein